MRTSVGIIVLPLLAATLAALGACSLLNEDNPFHEPKLCACDSTCSCDFEPAVAAECGCDPDCPAPCPCDEDDICSPDCDCDPECRAPKDGVACDCACDETEGCDGEGCLCDPECE